MRIFDCSISSESNKLHDSNSLGPPQNDIMSDLRKYSELYGVEFVDDYKQSDVIITNTVYPDYILKYSDMNKIPRVKRMDGICSFSMNDLKHRNEPLNTAALQSDKVIFISEYSRNSYHELYGGELKNECVVLNNVDDDVFKPLNKEKGDFLLCSSATNWSRKDKRFQSIIDLALRISDNMILIGQCDFALPSNILSVGYISDYERINNILNMCSVFVSPFFRCAGSKVTLQAMKVGLPILYPSSGGLPELVGDGGVMITDHNDIDFLDKVPELDTAHVLDRYHYLKNNYNSYKSNLPRYQETIKKYFDEILFK